MTADEFAYKHSTTKRPWGVNGFYWAVTVDGTDYLWRADNGSYDGWDRYMGG